MENNPDISIIIVSYNVKDFLLRCLRSIYSEENSYLKPEVIIIDNGSKDDSIAAVRSHFPHAIIIENKFNAGFPAANNQGIQIAKGEYIFLLNPDTEIKGNALTQLKDYLKNNPNSVIVAPQLLNSDGSIQTSTWKNHSVIDLLLETVYLYKFFTIINYDHEKLKTTFETKTVSGAALFFRKSLIEKTGMLDENLFWIEDADFCLRAQKFGTIVYLNTAQVIHHSGKSQKSNYNVAISNQVLGKLKYYKKHSNFLVVIIAYINCFFFIITRIIVFGLLSPVKTIYKLKAQAYIYSFNKYFKLLSR